MIVVKNLSFKYNQNKILDDINLHISKNEFVSITGHNGSGKTTLIKLVLGLLKPASGQIIIDGKKVKSKYNSIGYINQGSINIKLPVTVNEVINIGRLNKNSNESVEKIMDMLDVMKFKDTLYKNLSGGQKQRVNIARCLVQGSKLIIMDEPGSFLDTGSQYEIMEILKNLNMEKNITMLMISHNFEYIKKYSNKIFLLENKKIKRIRIS